jgi:hypothetical protein
MLNIAICYFSLYGYCVHSRCLYGMAWHAAKGQISNPGLLYTGLGRVQPIGDKDMISGSFRLQRYKTFFWVALGIQPHFYAQVYMVVVWSCRNDNHNHTVSVEYYCRSPSGGLQVGELLLSRI